MPILTLPLYVSPAHYYTLTITSSLIVTVAALFLKACGSAPWCVTPQARRRRLFLQMLYEPLQRPGVVVFGVSSGEDEGDITLCSAFAYIPQIL